ncbi:MAG: hypothetical protein LAT64_09815 [Phycisphaerales bacterium]|nr:hypothetical protein [Planctomycetota bacterium]MCH8509045.1 hypothetical protein [Phycisphaerales bacterium]
MDMNNLSPLAAASRDLVYGLSRGADPALVEAGCRDLLIQNTNGEGGHDTRAVDVAGEVIRGVLRGAVMLRTSCISAAIRGVAESGVEGAAGDAQRLSISKRTCRTVRDSTNASKTDYDTALEGAAIGARMTADELREQIEIDTPVADS